MERNYWDAVKMNERVSDRYLFGDEMLWSAHAVPVGEREVRGILPVSTIDEMENYVDLACSGDTRNHFTVLQTGYYAFNMSLFLIREVAIMDFVHSVQ